MILWTAAELFTASLRQLGRAVPLAPMNNYWMTNNAMETGYDWWPSVLSSIL
jgi:hypothetical protein